MLKTVARVGYCASMSAILKVPCGESKRNWQNGVYPISVATMRMLPAARIPARHHVHNAEDHLTAVSRTCVRTPLQTATL